MAFFEKSGSSAAAHLQKNGTEAISQSQHLCWPEGAPKLFEKRSLAFSAALRSLGLDKAANRLIKSELIKFSKNPATWREAAVAGKGHMVAHHGAVNPLFAD